MFSLVIGLLTMTTASDSLITLPTEPQALVREVETEPKAESIKDQEIINKITEVFGKDAEVMTKIAFCESSLRQFDETGKVLISKTNDRGLFQISWVHDEELKKLNLDVTKLEDNIAYAKYLFDNNELKDWQASAKCWQN